MKSQIFAGVLVMAASLFGDVRHADAQAQTAPNITMAIDSVWFTSGSDTVSKTNDQILRVIASELLAHPEYQQVAVQGFAAARGDGTDELTRWNLSLTRGRAVINALVQLGVQRERLALVAFGSKMIKEVGAGDDDLDRKVQLKIVQFGVPLQVVAVPVAVPVLQLPRSIHDAIEISAMPGEIASTLGLEVGAIQNAVMVKRVPRKIATPSIATALTPQLQPSVPVSPNAGVVYVGPSLPLGDASSCRIDANYSKQIAVGSLR
jgi:hypothetical protein